MLYYYVASEAKNKNKKQAKQNNKKENKTSNKANTFAISQHHTRTQSILHEGPVCPHKLAHKRKTAKFGKTPLPKTIKASVERDSSGIRIALVGVGLRPGAPQCLSLVGAHLVNVVTQPCLHSPRHTL